MQIEYNTYNRNIQTNYFFQIKDPVISFSYLKQSTIVKRFSFHESYLKQTAIVELFSFHKSF